MPTVSIPNQPAGTTFNFTGYIPTSSNPYNTCNAESVAGSGFNSITNPTQVVVLKNGDPVPTVSGFAGSTSVKGTVAAYLDSTGTKIQLPNPTYQYIILYELGVTDPTSSAFDQQDLVLLVTVTPS
jgi:hypothetical protein